MATKSNIRSMRFSNEILAMIEEQPGDTFTAKFEWPVMKCVKELPKKQTELEQLERQIRAKQQKMAEASSRYAKMINQLGTLEQKLYQLDFAIGRALDEWPKDES